MERDSDMTIPPVLPGAKPASSRMEREMVHTARVPDGGAALSGQTARNPGPQAAPMGPTRVTVQASLPPDIYDDVELVHHPAETRQEKTGARFPQRNLNHRPGFPGTVPGIFSPWALPGKYAQAPCRAAVRRRIPARIRRVQEDRTVPISMVMWDRWPTFPSFPR